MFHFASFFYYQKNKILQHYFSFQLNEINDNINLIVIHLVEMINSK